MQVRLSGMSRDITACPRQDSNLRRTVWAAIRNCPLAVTNDCPEAAIDRVTRSLVAMSARLAANRRGHINLGAQRLIKRSGRAESQT